MTDVLLESLLRQEEGPALDFKSYQYPFDKASDDEKSELLKDILAFTNTRRERSAYILIGVKEVKGGRSKVVGVKTHLDDARIHQFVNSKTQQAVDFSYSPCPFEGVEIGVIEIPVQEGLIHLKQPYGKLHANLVYIRDGSSTRTLTPAEIIRMSTPKPPRLVLEWADLDSRTVLPSPYTVPFLVLDPPLPAGTFNLAYRRARNPMSLPLLEPDLNPNYSQELIEFARDRALFNSLGLRIRNIGRETGKRIRFVGLVRKRKGLRVLDEMVRPPKRELSTGLHTTLFESSSDAENFRIESDKSGMELRDDDDCWEISVEFGDIRPKERKFAGSVLWFGSEYPCRVELEGQLIGENIPEPSQCKLEIVFESESRPMTREDVRFHLRDYLARRYPTVSVSDDALNDLLGT